MYTSEGLEKIEEKLRTALDVVMTHMADYIATQDIVGLLKSRRRFASDMRDFEIIHGYLKYITLYKDRVKRLESNLPASANATLLDFQSTWGGALIPSLKIV